MNPFKALTPTGRGRRRFQIGFGLLWTALGVGQAALTPALAGESLIGLHLGFAVLQILIGCLLTAVFYATPVRCDPQQESTLPRK